MGGRRVVCHKAVATAELLLVRQKQCDTTIDGCFPASAPPSRMLFFLFLFLLLLLLLLLLILLLLLLLLLHLLLAILLILSRIQLPLTILSILLALDFSLLSV